MALLPPIASYSSNITDLFTKPLSSHRYTQLIIGDDLHPTTTSAGTATADPVDLAPTSVAFTTAGASTVVASPTTSALVPIILDTGASFARTPFASDFALEVTQAPCGLIRSAALVNSVAKALAFTPVDPYTLITGEGIASASNIAFASDLSSPDTAVHSDSGSSFTKVFFDIREFGTASLTFIFSPNLSLIKVFVTPTQVDWIHWIPLPRLILPESYFHIFGLDYLQAFALFHLIPIWIYCLLHFGLE